MRAGVLRHRVLIEQPVTARDPVTGDVVETWATYAASVPAEIVPLSGREFLQSGANQAELTARATVRWDAGIQTTMRLVHEGRAYQITAVLPDPTFARHATLMLGTGVNDGR
jgi:SPP1 family predicted phage head-tail adaptor